MALDAPPSLGPTPAGAIPSQAAGLAVAVDVPVAPPLPTLLSTLAPTAPPTVLDGAPPSPRMTVAEVRLLHKQVRQLVRSPGVHAAQKAVAILRAQGRRLPPSVVGELVAEARRLKRTRLVEAISALV